MAEFDPMRLPAPELARAVRDGLVSEEEAGPGAAAEGGGETWLSV